MKPGIRRRFRGRRCCWARMRWSAPAGARAGVWRGRRRQFCSGIARKVRRRSADARGWRCGCALESEPANSRDGGDSRPQEGGRDAGTYIVGQSGCRVTPIQHFYLPDDDGGIITGAFDYVVDAIDTVSAKLDIVQKAQALSIPVISCMGKATSYIPSCSALQIFTKPAFVHCAALCVQSCAKGA